MIATLLILFLYFLPGIVCTIVCYHEIKEEGEDIYIRDLPSIFGLLAVSWLPVINLALSFHMIEDFCDYMKLAEPLKKFSEIKLYSPKKTEND